MTQVSDFFVLFNIWRVIRNFYKRTNILLLSVDFLSFW
jgi:hypothetical protein